jgi:hypothetical protein
MGKRKQEHRSLTMRKTSSFNFLISITMHQRSFSSSTSIVRCILSIFIPIDGLADDLHVGSPDDQGNEPIPDSGTINGIGQFGDSSNYFNLTLRPNTTYRLRLINSGSFAAVHFSVDGHNLTIIEADSTLVAPQTVNGLLIDVAQRYSVLITTASSPGAFWMRSTIQNDRFKYEKDFTNYAVRGIIRYGFGAPELPAVSLNETSGLGDLDIDLLVPTSQISPPNATVSFLVSTSMQLTG